MQFASRRPGHRAGRCRRMMRGVVAARPAALRSGPLTAARAQTVEPASAPRATLAGVVAGIRLKGQTRWPGDSAAIRLWTLGRGPSIDELLRAVDIGSSQRAVAVRAVTTATQAREGCHAVYVTGIDAAAGRELLRHLAGQPVLLLGEGIGSAATAACSVSIPARARCASMPTSTRSPAAACASTRWCCASRGCIGRRLMSARQPLLDTLRAAHLRLGMAAVVAAGLVLTLVSFLTLRSQVEQNLTLVARSISYTAEAAAVFGDGPAATEVLLLVGERESLRAGKHRRCPRAPARDLRRAQRRRAGRHARQRGRAAVRAGSAGADQPRRARLRRGPRAGAWCRFADLPAQGAGGDRRVHRGQCTGWWRACHGVSRATSSGR